MMKPLSVGNVVSAGLRIYRDNFKKYFKSAFLGYLCLFIPSFVMGAILGTRYAVNRLNGISVLLLIISFIFLIYGGAKYSSILALIARLAYGEVTEKPETVKNAAREIKPKTWKFLTSGILVFLSIVGLSIFFSIIFMGIVFVAALIGNVDSRIGAITGIILILVAVLFFLFSFFWLISRLLLAELPLAIGESSSATNTIAQSWNMTKGSAFRIQLVVMLGTLISIPILIASSLLSGILQVAISTGLSKTPILAGLAGIFYVLFSVASGALMIPFWQSIKAVIYYDLKVRREGMGLDLRK